MERAVGLYRGMSDLDGLGGRAQAEHQLALGVTLQTDRSPGSTRKPLWLELGGGHSQTGRRRFPWGLVEKGTSGCPKCARAYSESTALKGPCRLRFPLFWHETFRPVVQA